MKKSFILFTGLILSIGSILQAQDLDKVLASHYKAQGQKNLLKVNSLHVTGTINIMGMEGSFDMKSMRPNMGSVEMNIGGSLVRQGYDGKTAWQVNPMAGISSPVEVTGAEAEGIMDIGDMDGVLWDYEKKGNQVELQGSEEVNGTAVYVLKVTRPSGNNTFYYIDKEEYLIRKIRSTAATNGMEVESFPSDYKKVEGFMMPFTNELQSGGQPIYTLTFDEVAANVDMDASSFSKPD